MFWPFPETLTKLSIRGGRTGSKYTLPYHNLIKETRFCYGFSSTRKITDPFLLYMHLVLASCIAPGSNLTVRRLSKYGSYSGQAGGVGDPVVGIRGSHQQVPARPAQSFRVAQRRREP